MTATPCRDGCERPVHAREDGLGADGWCSECLSGSDPHSPLGPEVDDASA